MKNPWMCSDCLSEGDVVNSRKRSEYVIRRRECTRCKARWATYEITTDEYKELRELEHKLAELRKLWGAVVET